MLTKRKLSGKIKVQFMGKVETDFAQPSFHGQFLVELYELLFKKSANNSDKIYPSLPFSP